jgi:hypothetical protein
LTSFRDLQTEQDISGWVAELNQDRPERAAIMRHIVAQVKRACFEPLHLVELAPGAGHLAAQLLREMPQLTYTGLDSSELLLTYAQKRLAAFERRAKLIRVDLNADDWPDLLPDRVQAIVSMQSLHDLGDEGQVNHIYGLAKSLLVPGGLLLNADLVVPAGQTNPDNPGRLSVPRHLNLLRSHGYERVACTLELGDFGCLVAFTPVDKAG